jgi:TRAP-type C4-dicarboxylate transport system permease small subunit
MNTPGTANPLVRSIERLFVGTVMLAAIGVMLTGVFLRYVMVHITDALDMDSISFFWIEETGELLLCWLAFIGAAIGIAERLHFTVALLVHKLSPQMQRAVYIFNLGITAFVGGVMAWQGWKIAMLNYGLASPSLGISLAWGYLSATAGGILIVIYALKAINDPPVVEHLGLKVD